MKERYRSGERERERERKRERERHCVGGSPLRSQPMSMRLDNWKSWQSRQRQRAGRAVIWESWENGSGLI